MGVDDPGGLVSLFFDVADSFHLEHVRDDPAFWASEFFKREELYLSSHRVRYPFRRPQGSMGKKAAVRMGARGNRFAVAYGGWNQEMSPLRDPTLSPAELEMMNAVFPKPEMAVVRYERLSVLTNRALYASADYLHSPVAFAYGFEGSSARFDMGSILDQLEWDLFEDDLPIPRVLSEPYLSDEPVESRPDKAFKLLLGSVSRGRNPSR